MSGGTDQSSAMHGVMVSEFGEASIPRIFDTIGYDFLIIDCEHGVFDFSTVAQMCAVAAGLDITVFVRIPEIRRENIGKYLDMGANGLVVPMVSTAADAERIIRFSKYAPVGERGVSVTRAHSGYRVEDLKQYLQEANERTKVFVQLESVEALTNIEEIAAVEGLSGLLIGPNDLLQDMGVPGTTDDPRLAHHIKRTAALARSFGLHSGIITSNRSLLAIAIRAGMTVLCQGSDSSLIIAGANASRAELEGLLRREMEFEAERARRQLPPHS